jgi:hypothetical protein
MPHVLVEDPNLLETGLQSLTPWSLLYKHSGAWLSLCHTQKWTKHSKPSRSLGLLVPHPEHCSPTNISDSEMLKVQKKVHVLELMKHTSYL